MYRWGYLIYWAHATRTWTVFASEHPARRRSHIMPAQVDDWRKWSGIYSCKSDACQSHPKIETDCTWLKRGWLRFGNVDRGATTWTASVSAPVPAQVQPWVPHDDGPEVHAQANFVVYFFVVCYFVVYYFVVYYLVGSSRLCVCTRMCVTSARGACEWESVMALHFDVCGVSPLTPHWIPCSTLTVCNTILDTVATQAYPHVSKCLQVQITIV